MNRFFTLMLFLAVALSFAGGYAASARSVGLCIGFLSLAFFCAVCAWISFRCVTDIATGDFIPTKGGRK